MRLDKNLFPQLASNDSSADRQFQIDYCPNHVLTKDDKIVLTMTKECGTRLSSTNYFAQGYVEAKFRAAPTSGVVSAFIARSDPSKLNDEIDWEIVGKNTNEAQSNFFVDSELDHQRGLRHATPMDLSTSYHTYGIRWNSTYMEWSFNGAIQRALTKGESSKFPSKPMRMEIAIWDGTGTSGWAGETDYQHGPFELSIEQITIRYPC